MIRAPDISCGIGSTSRYRAVSAGHTPRMRCRRENHVDQEAKEKDGRSGERRNIDQTVFPEFAALVTSKRAESRRRAPGRSLLRRATNRSWCSMEYSYGGSLCFAGVIAHHGNKQVSDAGGAHVAESGESLAVNTIEEQNAAA